MLNLSKKFISVAVFAFTGQAFAAEITHLDTDLCDNATPVITPFNGPAIYGCNRKFECNGKTYALSYVFPIDNKKNTKVTDICTEKNADSVTKCRSEHDWSHKNVCFNKAIKDKIFTAEPRPVSLPEIDCTDGPFKGYYIKMTQMNGAFRFDFGEKDKDGKELPPASREVRAVFNGSGASGCQLGVNSPTGTPLIALNIDKDYMNGKTVVLGDKTSPPLTCKYNPEVMKRLCTKEKKAEATPLAPPVRVVNDGSTAA